MEKRSAVRKRKRFVLKMNDKPAVLLDISKTGLKLSAAFVPASRHVEISISYNGKSFHLKGNIRWVRRSLSLQSPKDLGIRIVEASEEYLKFVENI